MHSAVLTSITEQCVYELGAVELWQMILQDHNDSHDLYAYCHMAGQPF